MQSWGLPKGQAVTERVRIQKVDWPRPDLGGCAVRYRPGPWSLQMRGSARLPSRCG